MLYRRGKRDDHLRLRNEDNFRWICQSDVFFLPLFLRTFRIDLLLSSALWIFYNLFFFCCCEDTWDIRRFNWKRKVNEDLLLPRALVDGLESEGRPDRYADLVRELIPNQRIRFPVLHLHLSTRELFQGRFKKLDEW